MAFREEREGSLVGLPKAAIRLPLHLRAILPQQGNR
jgi:hypothetical protein